MFGYFYYGNIRKYVVAFGTLFNNIYIEKRDQAGNKSRFRIPLSYAAKDKYIRRLEEFPTLASDENNAGIAITYYPRMSFELTNITYDPTRKRNTLGKMFNPSSSGTSYSYMYSEVPYDISFSLNILTRKMDDGLQIIEQILPYFTPDFNLTMDLNDFSKKVDIPVVMDSYSQTIDYESDFDETTEHRMITWELTFTMKGFLFGPVKSGKAIREAITQFFDSDNEYRIESLSIGLSGGTGVSAANISYDVEIFGTYATDNDIFG